MHNVLDRQDAASTVVKPESRIARLRQSLAFRLGAIFSVIVGIVGVSASGASAAQMVDPDPTTDLTGGAGDTFFSSITDYLTGHLIVSVLVLFAIVVGVSMLMKWGKKAAKSG